MEKGDRCNPNGTRPLARGGNRDVPLMWHEDRKTQEFKGKEICGDP